jgi:hypothetical protein
MKLLLIVLLVLFVSRCGLWVQAEMNASRKATVTSSLHLKAQN